MFIFIKHGDNQQFLASTNCSVLLLLHYARCKVGLPETETIDLCDETGTMKLFFLMKTPGDYANKFLTARNTYYVCKVECGEPGTGVESGYKAFVPLLKNPEPELIDSLHTQCDLLERCRVKMLRSQETKKVISMESFMNLISKSPGRSDEEGTTHKAPVLKTKADYVSRKDKHH